MIKGMAMLQIADDDVEVKIRETVVSKSLSTSIIKE